MKNSVDPDQLASGSTLIPKGSRNFGKKIICTVHLLGQLGYCNYKYNCSQQKFWLSGFRVRTANSEDPDQTSLQGQLDQCLLCLSCQF